MEIDGKRVQEKTERRIMRDGRLGGIVLSDRYGSAD